MERGKNDKTRDQILILLIIGTVTTTPIVSGSGSCYRQDYIYTYDDIGRPICPIGDVIATLTSNMTSSSFSDVNKDLSRKDKDKDLSSKDRDKDKDLIE